MVVVSGVFVVVSGASVVVSGAPAYPAPSYMGCSMCNYKTICETYMYSTLDKTTILEEFKEEFKERETDHLEEKTERSVE